MVSGITMIILYPFAAASAASPIPVLPLVGSMSVVSAFNFPLSSAARRISAATLSFTDPTGFIDSTFTKSFARSPYSRSTFFRRTRGVRPTASAIDSKRIPYSPGQFLGDLYPRLFLL